MKSSDLDYKFDQNEDVTEFFDFSQASRPDLASKRVNVDFPECMESF